MSKIVECESTIGDPSDVVVCATILNGILPENYQMSVTRNDPEPPEFPGSSSGINVQLGEGDYKVDKTLADTTLLE